MITIDSENLLRSWNIRETSKESATSHLPRLSYRVPILGRITAAAVDPTNRFLAVGTSTGEAKVINLKSGGVLYELATVEKPQEITSLGFISGQTEYWLFGGSWGGRLMMWTNPSEDNNFTITARCKINHKSDIISLDCLNGFIATGDDQGVVSIWNAQSGQIKYAIDTPAPVTFGASSPSRFKKKSAKKEAPRGRHQRYESSSDEGSLDSCAASSDNVGDGTAATSPKGHSKRPPLGSMRKSIVGLCFHPFYRNHICLMQESGNIHMIDAAAGEISYKDLAEAKTNSSWACDPFRLRMLVVGDVGMACLFDISMGCMSDRDSRLCQQSNSRDLFGPYTYLENYHLDKDEQKQKGHEHDARGTKRNVKRIELSPSRFVVKGRQRLGAANSARWEVVKKWFPAHDLDRMDPAYLVSVKFAAVARVYITATTLGEVKLWDSFDLSPIGTLNHTSW